MRPRMKADLKRKGFNLISIKQKVIGLGWMTYKSPNIFTVRYIDTQGNEHQSYCEPNLFWGNTWSNDIIVKYAPQHRTEHLAQTRNRLKKELDRIEQNHQFEINSLRRRYADLQNEFEQIQHRED